MKKYALSSRIIHWLMAALILFMLGLGIYMDDFLAKDASNRMEIYSLHKSLGVVALIFIFIRIINRIIVKVPELPATLASHEKILSKIMHGLLYLLMLVVPSSGYLMSNFYGYPVMLFGLKMPFLVEKNPAIGKICAEIHEIGAFTLLACVVLHVAAVIKHRFFDSAENNVLGRMI